ncbi:MAG: hypothetical protein DWQ04_09555 [Chloroflexi bacterium]|nr:MAG: hypothetical protein DWQ04_09555 [Chloroflexota bacterium]
MVVNRLEVSLLGSFQITINEQLLTNFESDKARALLAYLVIEANHSHRREALAALLWSNKPTSAARNNLRQTLYRLRKTICDYEKISPYFIITPKEIQFTHNNNTWVDVHIFNRSIQVYKTELPEITPQSADLLIQAVGLYRSNLLSGFTLANCPEFEWWLMAKRERYHRLALESLQHLTHYFICREDYDRAIHYAQHQIEREPWFEPAHRSKMLALALVGQTADALYQFEQCQQILLQVLDIQPALQTRRLAEKIRQGSFLGVVD